jgi:hypothetical protein
MLIPVSRLFLPVDKDFLADDVITAQVNIHNIDSGSITGKGNTNGFFIHIHVHIAGYILTKQVIYCDTCSGSLIEVETKNGIAVAGSDAYLIVGKEHVGRFALCQYLLTIQAFAAQVEHEAVGAVCILRVEAILWLLFQVNHFVSLQIFK